MNLVRSLLPAALASMLFACSDTGEPNTFEGPLDDGKAECVTYQSKWPQPLSTSCTDCLHEECVAAWQAMMTVCAGDPAERCSQDGGGKDASTYCACMVGQPKGCGTALANVYACFVNDCSAACDADAGKAGSGGSAKDAGAGG